MPTMHSVKRQRDSAMTSPKKEFIVAPGILKPELKTTELNDKSNRIKKEPKYEWNTDGNKPEVKSSSSQKRKVTREKPKSGKKIKFESKVNDSPDDHPDWNVERELAVHFNLDLDASINIVELIEDDNTIPFIARYRREKTGNMDANNLRNFVDCYETLKSVQSKTHTMIQSVTKTGKMTPALLKSFHTARSMEELEHLYAPFKTNKKSLADRAKVLGLDVPAVAFLDDPCGPSIDLTNYIQPTTKGLASLQEVETGVQHIIADIIAKDYAILKCVQEIFLSSNIQVCCKLNRNFEKKLKSGENLEDSEAHKFEQYYNFRRGVSVLQPHQVMAINRGENLKILAVKLDIPENLKKRFIDFTYHHFCKSRTPISEINRNLIDSCIKDACERFIEPLVCRRLRSELTKKAEKASVEIFVSNLRNLLLASPIQGKVITAIDPGFTNGCKLAVVASNGNVLHTTALYLHNNSRGYQEAMKLVDVILKFRSTVIGIGNGTACRQTEAVVTKLIRNNKFHPLNVVYCIVSESGVSVYSVSDEAATEFPDMDPNQRSAVSLARRLLDPLSEHVKVEPKHLGVGLYQHDISESLLKKSLENVVEECVSFTGIDVNMCTKVVLSKVAGLTARRAEAIIKWRKENGAFINREQIRLVTGIGPKTYEQCAGFLKILTKTLDHCQTDDKNTKMKPKAPDKAAKSKKKSVTINCTRNLLDATCIHPESYEIALKVITAAECNLNNLGSPNFIATMKRFLTENKIAQLASEFGVGISTIKLIVDGLQRELDYDIRTEFSRPLFKQGIRDVSSLEIGMRLSGKVMNVTSFGVFVDIGVGRDGLIHISRLRPCILNGRPLVVGDCVEVEILNIEEKKKRISLGLSAVTERSMVDLH